MSTILLLEIVMANLLIFAENKKLPSVDGADGSDGMRGKGGLFYVVAAGLLGILMLNEILLCQYRQVTVNGGGSQFCQLDYHLALYTGILLDNVVGRPDCRTKTL